MTHLCGRPCTSRRRRYSNSAPLKEPRKNIITRLKTKTYTGGLWNRSGDGGGAPRAVTTGDSTQTISLSPDLLALVSSYLESSAAAMGGGRRGFGPDNSCGGRRSSAIAA